MGTMQIDVIEDSFRLAQVFTISRGSRTQADVLTVSVAEDGVVGHGECVPYARYDETLASVTGQIKAFDGVWADLPDALTAGAARNALDCAFWDLAAKKAGVRGWDLLNLPAPQPEITAYTLSLDTPEKMQMQAAENAARPLLKIKLGTPDDMARLEAVRRGAPDSRIIVDANEGWDADVYADLAPHLIRLGVQMVEQPLPAGADDMLAEIDRPMVNIKLDKTGGLTEALALKEAALAQGYGVMVGCMVGSSLAMAPATILAQGVAFTDLDGPLLLAEDRDEPLKFDEAGVHAPSAGLWG